MTNEIEKLTTDFTVQAAMVRVVDQASASRVADLILLGKDAIKGIKAFYAKRKAKAHELWKLECDEENVELAKVTPVLKRLDENLTSWRLEEDRKRREAEAAVRRAEEERQRLEQEALRKVKEAEEAAERDRLRLEREAEELQKKEREALAASDKAALAKIEERREEIHQEAQAVLASVERATDEAINIAAKAEAAMGPVPVAAPAARTEGLRVNHNYSFEVEDKAALPEKYKIADQVELNKMARLMEMDFKIPGGKVVDHPTMASIGKRNGPSLN